MVHVFKPRAFNQKKNRWNKLILNCFKESMKLKRKMDNLKFMVSMNMLINSLLLLKCKKIEDNVNSLIYKVNTTKSRESFKD